MPPFVSIVTVSLNAAETIADTIASVALQKFDFGIEHVLVDGGSQDATRAIIDQSAATFGNIRRIYERDRGIYDAMNKGLLAASGEYVLFLNADDFLVTSDTLAVALRGLSPGASSNPDLVVGDVAMGALGRRGVWRHRRVPKWLLRYAGSGLFPIHQGRFIKRAVLNAVGGFDAESRLAADVTQYYDMERRFSLKVRILAFDVAFMRTGGAANAGLRAMYLGSREIFSHLRKDHGAIRAASMTLVKTAQSLSEVRWGVCPHRRWFAGQ